MEITSNSIILSSCVKRLVNSLYCIYLLDLRIGARIDYIDITNMGSIRVEVCKVVS